jgi:protein TonB
MSYAQRKQLSGNPVVAWTLTIALVGGLLYAIVTGLAYNVVKKGIENLKVVDVEDTPPPPPKEPPPPPKDMPPAPPPPITPPPPPRKVQSAQSAKGDLRTLFTADDYPASAQSAGAEGTSQAEITIGTDGRVVGCNIIRSSGNSALDQTTCNILRRRAKFTPARDSNGNPTTDSITTPPITWRLEG